jgi:predicted  nucleic acid-binding Zn-ribbon protein
LIFLLLLQPPVTSAAIPTQDLAIPDSNQLFPGANLKPHYEKLKLLLTAVKSVVENWTAGNSELSAFISMLQDERTRADEYTADLVVRNRFYQKDNATLREDNTILREDNTTLREDIEILRKDNKKLRYDNKKLQEEIVYVKATSNRRES